MSGYTVLYPIAKISNQWVTLIGERVRDENGALLDYWRVERPDSVIVIPLIRGNIVIPNPYYRHGIGETTYDFPGGRIKENDTPDEAAYEVLKRELAVEREHVSTLEPINKEGWIVDSSFSSQKVYSFQAILQEDLNLNEELVAMQEPMDTQGASRILKHLHCLQCRHALLEWMVSQSADPALCGKGR